MRIVFLLLFVFPLFALDDIVVEVKASDQIAPLYLASIEPKENGFAQNYCQQLMHVLQFDFQNNGKTTLVAHSLERSQLSQNSCFDSKRWKAVGVSYFVKPEIVNKKLTLTTLDVKTGRVQRSNEILLSGNLSQDRQLLHQASDAAFFAFFGIKGVASKRILYTLRTKKGTSSQDWITEVWEADYDFANQRKLTHGEHLCVTPVYVPNSRDYLYVSYKIGQPKIFLASTEGGEGRRLTFLRGNQLMPTVSLQQDRIAFISDITGNPDLFIQEFSLQTGVVGKPQQIFHAPGATQGTPSFSPDGKKLAFVSNKDGTPRIYVMMVPQMGSTSADSTPTLISKKNHGNTSPAWSPNGRYIAYSALTGKVRQIWIYDFTTNQEWQLTDGPYHKENPAWAENSLHLMYNTQADQVAELYLINLNQKVATKISSGSGEKRFPAW